MAIKGAGQSFDPGTFSAAVRDELLGVYEQDKIGRGPLSGSQLDKLSKSVRAQLSEVDRVADPLSNVLDNLPSKTKNKLNKFSAPILLGSALGSIVVPRVLMEFALYQKGGVKIGNQPKNGSVNTGVSGQGTTEPRIQQGTSETVATVDTTVDPAISQLLDNVG
jgi:hypothetical protein